MPRNPSVKAETICDIIARYGAVDFTDALGDFIAGVLNDILPGRATWYRSKDVFLPFSRVPVYHSMKFTSDNHEESEIVQYRTAKIDKFLYVFIFVRKAK
jgi:hypothetical protein